MGRIHQLNPDYSIPAHEQKSINTTQWRYITVYEEATSDHKAAGIDVCINTQVYFIYDITLHTFNRINQNNESGQFKYEYKCTHITCRKCYGRGIVDWVDKIVDKSNRPLRADMLHGKNYIRNKKGIVNLYRSDYWEKTTFLYSSTPKLKVGEEFCPECLGCGIKMINNNKFTETTFNQC